MRAAALLGQNGFLFLIFSVYAGRDPRQPASPSSSPYHLLVVRVLFGLSETDLDVSYVTVIHHPAFIPAP